MTTADVIILGAGPAGCATAITAASAGLRVIVLERSAFPRHRPGETLHPGVEPLLTRLGIWDAVREAKYTRHTGTWVKWGNPMRFTSFGSDGRGEWQGFQAIREDFDARLVARARTAGAEVSHGAMVERFLVEDSRVVGVTTEMKQIYGRFVVDATGGGHRLARFLGIPIQLYSRFLMVRYGYMTGDCPIRDDAPLLEADESGWTWTARIGPRRYQWTRLELVAGRTMANWRPSEFASLHDDGPVRGADVTWRIAQRVAGAGFFLVGDAAAVLDPASSHGVLRALMSGMMVGHLLGNSASARGNVAWAHWYDSWLREWFLADVRHLRELYSAAKIGVAEATKRINQYPATTSPDGSRAVPSVPGRKSH